MDTLQVDDPRRESRGSRLNRPERLNAMNAALISELHGALADVAVAGRAGWSC